LGLGTGLVVSLTAVGFPVGLGLGTVGFPLGSSLSFPLGLVVSLAAAGRVPGFKLGLGLGTVGFPLGLVFCTGLAGGFPLGLVFCTGLAGGFTLGLVFCPGLAAKGVELVVLPAAAGRVLAGFSGALTSIDSLGLPVIFKSSPPVLTVALGFATGLAGVCKSLSAGLSVFPEALTSSFPTGAAAAVLSSLAAMGLVAGTKGLGSFVAVSFPAAGVSSLTAMGLVAGVEGLGRFVVVSISASSSIGLGELFGDVGRSLPRLSPKIYRDFRSTRSWNCLHMSSTCALAVSWAFRDKLACFTSLSKLFQVT
jgi:hypothetical protein